MDFHKTKISAMVLLTLTMAGCSSLGVGKKDFSCEKDKHQGVSCKSAREVYELTHDRDAINDVVEKKDDEKYLLDHISSMFGDEEAAKQQATNSQTVQLPNLEQLGYQTPINPPSSYALREEAKQMTIWIAPYPDSEGDLRMPGYMFTEVEAKTWKIGPDAIYHAGAIAPLSTRVRNGSPDMPQGANTNLKKHNKADALDLGANLDPTALMNQMKQK